MSRFVLLTFTVAAALGAAQNAPVSLNACAATSCLVGSVCVEQNGVARCVAPGNEAAPTEGNCTVRFEEWRECASCEATCDNRNPMCNRMCQPSRCMCRQGFYRSKEGQCVTENDCDAALPRNIRSSPEPKCKKNQVFRECSSMCAPKCGEYEPRPCVMMCGPPRCECDVGFYLDNHGECVTRAECEAQSSTPKTPGQSDCKPNEKFAECSTMCEEKCGEYELTRPCPAACGPPKCQCDIGFYRNTAGECVSRSECDEPRTTRREDETPKITCANIRCAGGCRDTPSGPRCGGPRPQILPIWAGPTSN